MKLARVAVLAVLGGCGAFGDQPGDDAGVPIPIDAPRDIGEQCLSCCNPVSPAGQQGCATGQRCTWVVEQETPIASGHLGCVPDGSQPLGAACTWGPVGETTGFDDCAVGGVCIAGICRDICSFDNTSVGACAEGERCARHDGLFGDGGEDPYAGVCEPR